MANGKVGVVTIHINNGNHCNFVSTPMAKQQLELLLPVGLPGLWDPPLAQAELGAVELDFGPYTPSCSGKTRAVEVLS
ncbi:unnamed protein product [Prunus armeniaca]